MTKAENYLKNNKDTMQDNTNDDNHIKKAHITTIQAGITLIELMVTLAIAGILVMLATPSFQESIERKRIKAVVESLRADLQLARWEAIKRSQNISLTIISTGDNGDWCYGLSTSDVCDCKTVGSCEIKAISGEQYSSSIFFENSTATTAFATFNFRRGTVGANGITVRSPSYSARVVVGNVGRARVCTPSGATGLQEYPDC